MSRWLPPAGGGYSGRSVTGDRDGQTAAARNPKAAVNGSSRNAGGSVGKERSSRVPQDRGSAGVGRAK